MSNWNFVVVEGHLSKEPEVKYTQSGTAVASLSIGNNVYQGKDKADKVNWFNVVAWKHTAEYVGKYAHKGDRLVVKGELSHRTWDDKDGNKRSTVEIVAREIIIVPKRDGAAPADVEMTMVGADGPPLEDSPF